MLLQGGPVWRSPSFVIHHISSLCNQNNSSKAEHPSSISVCDQLSIRCHHDLPYRFKIVHMNAFVGMIPNCQVNGSPAGRTKFCRNNAFQQAFLSGKLLHRQIPGQRGRGCQQIVPGLSTVIGSQQDAGALFAASQKDPVLLTKKNSPETAHASGRPTLSQFFPPFVVWKSWPSEAAQPSDSLLK